MVLPLSVIARSRCAATWQSMSLSFRYSVADAECSPAPSLPKPLPGEHLGAPRERLFTDWFFRGTIFVAQGRRSAVCTVGFSHPFSAERLVQLTGVRFWQGGAMKGDLLVCHCNYSVVSEREMLEQCTQTTPGCCRWRRMPRTWSCPCPSLRGAAARRRGNPCPFPFCPLKLRLRRVPPRPPSPTPLRGRPPRRAPQGVLHGRGFLLTGLYGGVASSRRAAVPRFVRWVFRTHFRLSD